MRMEALPMLNLWNQVLMILAPESMGNCEVTSTMTENFQKYWQMTLENVDYVPASLPTSQDAGCRLVMCEDNDAVIKMLRKGRAPMMAHVARTHRVNLDWLLERSYTDPNVYCRYVDTKMHPLKHATAPNQRVAEATARMYFHQD